MFFADSKKDPQQWTVLNYWRQTHRCNWRRGQEKKQEKHKSPSSPLTIFNIIYFLNKCMIICVYNPDIQLAPGFWCSEGGHVTHCHGGGCECKQRWEDSSPICQLQRWREAPACLPWYSLPVLFMLCWYRVWMILGKGVGYAKIITSKFDTLEPPCVDKDRWVGGWCLLSDVVALKIGYPLCSSHRMGWG